MKKFILVLGLLVLLAGQALAQVEKADLDEWAKENPALAEELVEIYAIHPGWRGTMLNDEAKMRWVLDNAEKYPMTVVVFLEYVDNDPKSAVWVWEHPVIAKRTIIYAGAHKKAARFAAKHPGMARWVAKHPVKAKWMAHHPVKAKKILKHKSR